MSEARPGIAERNAPLRTDIELARGGVGDAAALRRSLRDSVLYVLRYGEDQLIAADEGGIQWIYAFTSERELALFAAGRGGGDAEVDYLTVRGDRLLEEAVPSMAGPAGVVIDVAGEQPVLLPIGERVVAQGEEGEP